MEGPSSKKRRQSPDKHRGSPSSNPSSSNSRHHKIYSTAVCDPNGKLVREGRSRHRSRGGSSKREVGRLKDENEKIITSPRERKKIAGLPELSRWTDEEINQNPFLDDCEGSPSKVSNSQSRNHSSSKGSYGFHAKDCNNNGDLSNSRDTSRSNSAEGTPVILSREGSRLRVVDSETGEVFFKKLPTNNLREFTGKEPIFIPRLSSSSSILTSGSTGSDRDLMNARNKPKSPMSHKTNSILFDIQEDTSYATEDNDNGDDEGDDILVLRTSFEEQADVLRNLPTPTKGILKKPSGVKGQSKSDRVLSPHKNHGEKEASLDINGNTCQRESPKRSRSRSKSPKDKEKAGEERRGKREDVKKSKTNPLHEMGQKPVISEGRMRTQEKLPVLPDATRHTRSPSRSKSRTSSRRRIGHETATLIPSEVFEEIFSYLNARDLESCSRVCRRWKKLTDPYTRGPLLFRGRKHSYTARFAPEKSKKLLLYLQELEAKAYRPYTIRLEFAVNSQIQVMCTKYGNQFRSSIRHMGALQLHNCSFRWRTLIHLLQSFANLKTLSDTNGSHFSRESSFACKGNLQSLEKELKRQEFLELKNQLKKLKKLSIKRTTVDEGLVIYFHVLGQGARCVESFDLTIGPHDTPGNQEKHLGSLVSHFTRALHSFLSKNTGSMKRIKFCWTDKGYNGYFGNALDALDDIEFKCLTEINFSFDASSLKTPKQLSKFKRFLEFHCMKSLTKVTISRLVLGQWWEPTLDTIESLQDHLLFVTSFNLHIQVNDEIAIGNLLERPLLHEFVTSLHISISSDKSRSVSQIIGKELKGDFPRVKSVLVTFEPTEKVEGYPNFQSYSLLSLTHHVPCLTELRISDRLLEHNQMFNKVIGRKSKANVSAACIQNGDIVSICKGLPRLRVLKLWANLSKVDDHGITGIHPSDIAVLTEDDVNYTWDNFGHELKANFSSLIDLEELSLKGLGKKVTNISAKFGFQNLKSLKVLEIWGETTITRIGRLALRRYLKQNETILKFRRC